MNQNINASAVEAEKTSAAPPQDNVQPTDSGKNYEMLFIVSNQFTDDEAKKIKEKINGLIKSQGGAIGWQDSLGKKKLAYPIKKVAHGHYFVMEFELTDGAALKEIDRALKLDKEIVRHQIIAKPKITAEEIKRLKKHERETVSKFGAKLAQEEKRAEKPTLEKKKASIENLEEKLDEILKDDIL